MRRAISQRATFTESEVQYMVDILDNWVESHQTLRMEDDEVAYMHESMSVAVDVRDKLWRQLNG